MCGSFAISPGARTSVTLGADLDFSPWLIDTVTNLSYYFTALSMMAALLRWLIPFVRCLVMTSGGDVLRGRSSTFYLGPALAMELCPSISRR